MGVQDMAVCAGVCVKGIEKNTACEVRCLSQADTQSSGI